MACSGPGFTVKPNPILASTPASLLGLHTRKSSTSSQFLSWSLNQSVKIVGGRNARDQMTWTKPLASLSQQPGNPTATLAAGHNITAALLPVAPWSINRYHSQTSVAKDVQRLGRDTNIQVTWAWSKHAHNPSSTSVHPPTMVDKNRLARKRPSTVAHLFCLFPCCPSGLPYPSPVSRAKKRPCSSPYTAIFYVCSHLRHLCMAKRRSPRVVWQFHFVSHLQKRKPENKRKRRRPRAAETT